jgi:hypothetical protein
MSALAELAKNANITATTPPKNIIMVLFVLVISLI